MKFAYQLNDAWVDVYGQFVDEDFFEIDTIDYKGIDLLPVVSEQEIENIEAKAKEKAEEMITEAKIARWED